MTVQRNKSWLYIVLLGAFFASCGKAPVFDTSHSFKDQRWGEQDEVVFQVEVEDTVTPFDFVITLRTTTSYAYNNLWFYISSTAPDGITSKVAHRMNIARGDGSWIGRVSGSAVESKLTFRTQAFPYTGTYLFKIELATQQPEIKEVLDISLRIQKHGLDS